MIVVSVIIFVFLLHARSALIPILTLPVGVLLAFVPMFYQHLTANIMSLGGIAVAIGAMVDASIILIENIHKKLGEWDQAGQHEPRTDVIIAAMQEVGPSIFFSLLVITISFLPVFTLEATEGRLFKPLAFTKTYSIGFASILAVTLTPALAALFIRGKVLDESKNPLNRWLTAAYTPVVRFVFEHRWMVVALALLTMVLTAPAALRLSSEFMPPLNEGVILYMPTAPPGMSENEASVILQSMDRELKKFPEVVSVFGKMGRSETATDPAPLGMAEVTVVLKPRTEWRPGLTWDGLLEEMDEKLHYPGMPNVWWMPIQTRTEMLATGVKSPLGIEVYGDDLEAIEKAAIAVEHAVSKVPGTRSAFAERSTGGFYIDFQVDREAAARHGLSVAGRQHGRGPVDRRRERLRDCRGPRALPDQRPLRARVPRRSRAPRPHAHQHPRRRADPVVAGRERPRRPRAADDSQRRRQARRLRLRRHRPPDRRLRRGSEARRRQRACSCRPGRGSSGSASSSTSSARRSA